MAERGREPKEYLVYEAGAMLPADGTFLVLRLDAPDNKLERFVASVYADLSPNQQLRGVVNAELEQITGQKQAGGPILGVTGYGGGSDAGLAGRNTL